MFCKKCGKQINSYELCGSEVPAPAKFNHYDQRNGEQIYVIAIQWFHCEKWGHYIRTDGISDAKLKKRGIISIKRGGYDSDDVYHVPKSALVGDRLVVGTCKTKCCPNCGDTAPKKEDRDGCFIASAVYDSPSAPEVITLRRFRDEVLLQSKTGQIFVAIYYRISPPLAHVILKSKAMKKMLRNYILEPIVRILKKSMLKINLT